jgi:hypothetical protein
MARNIGPQILMKEVSNYIAGHKYRRGAWNLSHKFHLYLIHILYSTLLFFNNIVVKDVCLDVLICTRFKWIHSKYGTLALKVL